MQSRARRGSPRNPRGPAALLTGPLSGGLATDGILTAQGNAARWTTHEQAVTSLNRVTAAARAWTDAQGRQRTELIVQRWITSYTHVNRSINQTIN